MDEEAQTSLTAKRTPWPAGLRSVEQRKEEEEREQETRRLPQEEQRLQQKEGEEGHPPAGPQLEELLEQDRQRELQELQEQQQLRGQQLEELLEPPSHSPPQPVPLVPQRAWKPRGGSASFRSSNPGVAPSRGARLDPSKVRAGGRRGRARLYDAHPR